MQYLGKILAISHTELTGVMSETYVKALRHRGILQQLRRACPGTEALFAVDSLPEKYRQTVLTMYPTPEHTLACHVETATGLSAGDEMEFSGSEPYRTGC